MTTLFEALRAQNKELLDEREAMLAEVHEVRSRPSILMAAVAAAAIHRCEQADLHNKIGELGQVISDRDYEIVRLREGNAVLLAEFEAHKSTCRDYRDRLARADVLNEKLVGSLVHTNELLDAKARDLDALSLRLTEAEKDRDSVQYHNKRLADQDKELNRLRDELENGRSVEAARPKRAKG